MRILILSVLCLIPSIYAGKNKQAKAARNAAQKEIDAKNTAMLAAIYAANAAKSQHEVNCTGHCFKCDPGYMIQQGQYDKH